MPFYYFTLDVEVWYGMVWYRTVVFGVLLKMNPRPRDGCNNRKKRTKVRDRPRPYLAIKLPYAHSVLTSRQTIIVSSCRTAVHNLSDCTVLRGLFSGAHVISSSSRKFALYVSKTYAFSCNVDWFVRVLGHFSYMFENDYT